NALDMSLRIVCCLILPISHVQGNLMRDGDLKKYFAGRLRASRKARGLSQEELAHAAGLHRTHVSLIERSRRAIRLETLMRLAKALNVEPADLLPPLRLLKNGKATRPSSRQSRTG